MSYALGVVFFSVALLVSVMLHEAGHFSTAKAFGMKASRFFVGFGPTLWSFTRGETEYGIKAVPAGGFVKIEGMTALDEVAPGDEDRAFYKQPPGKRAIVLAAGSTVHFIIAIVLVFGILVATGKDPIRSDGAQVSSVATCITTDPSGTCRAGDPVAPAHGKLQAGDRIVAVNGVTTNSDGSNITAILRDNPDRPVRVTVERDGSTKSFTMTPAPVTIHGVTIGRIGITEELHAAPVSVLGAFPRTFTLLGDFIRSTGTAIKGIPHEVAQIVQGQQRSNQGAASVVDIARVSGQISSSGASSGQILAALLLIIAELNLFVGIFNLLPLLPLDGGHLAILGFEETRSAAARWRGRPDPGRVDIMKIMPLTYAVVAAFIGLSLILLYAGIAHPIRLQ
ncbi:MAG TPA: site-2 protease family protein [Mycobacteriales bacterium]|nr:site-2 protease family protein [Mycobacteriales bacterium]